MEKDKNSENLNYLMKAICGFIFPAAIERKLSSVNENVASGFPLYGPETRNISTKKAD